MWERWRPCEEGGSKSFCRQGERRLLPNMCDQECRTWLENRQTLKTVLMCLLLWELLTNFSVMLYRVSLHCLFLCEIGASFRAVIYTLRVHQVAIKRCWWFSESFDLKIQAVLKVTWIDKTYVVHKINILITWIVSKYLSRFRQPQVVLGQSNL